METNLIRAVNDRPFFSPHIHFVGAESDARPFGRMVRLYREAMDLPPKIITVTYKFITSAPHGPG